MVSQVGSYDDLRAEPRATMRRGARPRACEGIIIIKLLDPTHRAESRFTALLTRMNDYVSSPNLDARHRIIQLGMYASLRFDYVTVHLT